EELVDATALLSSQPLPAGRRTAVATNAGGLGILCADACEAAGLELPELSEETRRQLREALPVDASVANPIDLLGSATASAYETALPLLLADPGVDSVIALFVPPVVATAEDVAAAIARAGHGATKPLLAVVVSAEGIPTALRRPDAAVAAFAYPESAARALGLAVTRSDWLRRASGSTPALDGIDTAAARAVVEAALGHRDDRWPEPKAVRALPG